VPRLRSVLVPPICSRPPAHRSGHPCGLLRRQDYPVITHERKEGVAELEKQAVGGAGVLHQRVVRAGGGAERLRG
jgi:hypothetical protein